jgi:hypothetical protein
MMVIEGKSRQKGAVHEWKGKGLTAWLTTVMGWDSNLETSGTSGLSGG